MAMAGYGGDRRVVEPVVVSRQPDATMLLHHYHKRSLPLRVRISLYPGGCNSKKSILICTFGFIAGFYLCRGAA